MYEDCVMTCRHSQGRWSQQPCVTDTGRWTSPQCWYMWRHLYTSLGTYDTRPRLTQNINDMYTTVREQRCHCYYVKHQSHTVATVCGILSQLGGSVVEWLGCRTHDSRVEGLPPGHDTAWLFISETGDCIWHVNCLGNCNHHLGQLSLASLRGR